MDIRGSWEKGYTATLCSVFAIFVSTNLKLSENKSMALKILWVTGIRGNTEKR